MSWFSSVREAEVAQRSLVTRDALHGDVVVLGRREVRSARALLAVDRVREVVERARVRSRAVELSGTSGYEGSTSFQFDTVEPGFQIALSRSTVRHVTQSFSS